MDAPLSTPEHRAAVAGSNLWRTAALVSGVFSLLVCLGLVLHQLRFKTNDPVNSAALSTLKTKLQTAPEDESLKVRIREHDLRLRREYFQHVRVSRTGAWLLFISLGLFLFSWKRSLVAPVRLPAMIGSPQPAESRQAVQSRWALSSIGAALGLLVLIVKFSVGTSVPESDAASAQLSSGKSGKAAAPDFATEAEMFLNWPRFRGPTGDGIVRDTNSFAGFDPAAITLLWKTELSAPGFNSPVVWDGRVFVTGGDAAKRELFCLSATNGVLLWQRTIDSTADAAVPAIPAQTGYAASTCATDGRRVYAMFATGDLAAFTLDGAAVWSRHFGPLKNTYGHASSLALFQGKLIVQIDQGDSRPQNSKLCAIDGGSGEVVWEKNRQSSSTWSTPIVARIGERDQIVTLGIPHMIGYSAADGLELWRAELLEGEITPSPVFAGGLVLAVSPSAKLAAIRADGQGDVTKSGAVWTAEENIPDIASPISNGDLVFTVTSAGQLTCFELRDGKKAWEEDLKFDVQASPSLVGTNLLVLGKEGKVLWAAAARNFKQLSLTDLAENIAASPAFWNGRIFVRTDKQLFCLGNSAVAPPHHL